MSANEPATVGCRIVAEFDDDAAAFAAAAPELVPVAAPEGNARPLPAALSEETAAAAKKSWLRIIRRFTEPVPGKKRRLRVLDSEEPNRGEIVIEFGRSPGQPARCLSGYELDAADKLCLSLF